MASQDLKLRPPTGQGAQYTTALPGMLEERFNETIAAGEVGIPKEGQAKTQLANLLAVPTSSNLK